MAGRSKSRGDASLTASQFAYRGYLVKPGFDGMWYVSKDGHHISSEKTAAAAKATIDMLTGSAGERKRRKRRGAREGAMKLKIGGEGQDLCAWVENVPSWVETAGQLYDYLEDVANAGDKNVRKWLNTVHRAPGWWRGRTFVALDAC